MSSHTRDQDPTEQREESNRYTASEAAGLREDAFGDGPVDRRTFLGLAAATGAALALPSTVAADEVTDDAMSDELEFVVNYSRADYAAPTVVEFADGDALAAFADEYEEPIDEDLSRAPQAVTREEPTPAAHAHLTAEEVSHVLERGGVEHMDFAPGANPFWTLEEPYADGVFPPVEEARDYISHRETDAAMSHLEETYPDRVNFQVIGHGPGHDNQYTGEDPDPRDVYVVEVTNDVRDEESFREKEKAVYLVGIHGDERQGVEAGCRIIEQAAKGEADDFNPLLDDVVLVFMFVNPDGWVVRKPQFEFVNPNTGEQVYNFQRGNASGLDTNRQYPTIGWTNPAFWPAEPEGAPEVRPGYDVGYEEVVPDALANVAHLRQYENVTFLCDYHGMFASDWFVLNLETNAPFDHDGTHELDQVNVRIGEGMDDHWGGMEAIQNDVDRVATDRYGYDPDGAPFNPEGLFNWGTIYDSIGYQVTGAFLGWAGMPEEWGGLGARTVAPEMSWANNGTYDEKEWKPYIARHQTTAYRISMREYAEMAAAENEATVVTGGKETAYLSTDELTRSSADLSHTDERPGRGGGRGQDRATEVRRRHDAVRSGPDGAASVASDERTHSLAVRLHAHGVSEGVVKVRNPAGRIVHQVDLSETDERACCMGERNHLYVPDPANGDWTVECDGEDEVDVDFVALETDEEHPDPEEVLGYTQREYVVNPMQFFEDLEPFLEDGSIDGLRVHDVRTGRLVRGRSGERRYDTFVVSHDVASDDPEYVEAIEEFVEAGGDLVLTDAGVNLLAVLDVGDAAAIGDEDLRELEVQIPNLVGRDFDHPLLTDVREIQREVWKISQVGYTTGNDSPATIVDDDAAADVGMDVAGRMEQWEGSWWDPELADAGVAAGTVAAGDAEIEVIGSILPPANQRELHPFGMADYALSFFGHTLLCNALGFEQRRYTDGELVGTYGTVR